jgi:tRNA G10  N-methylase Trm11
VGTILQEGLLTHLDVVGVDIDRESVEASKKNLNWLKEKYNLKNKFKVINGDAKELTRNFKRNSIQGVATEPYLGPYHKKLPTREKVMGEIKNLERLYYEFLTQLRQILKKNGKVAIVIPRLKFHRGSEDLDIKGILRNSGFKISDIDERVKLPIVSEGRFLDRLIYVLE